MKKAFQKALDELAGQFELDTQATIERLETWEHQVGDLMATLDELHAERIKQIEENADKAKKEALQTHASMQTELRKMGESVREHRHKVIGNEPAEVVNIKEA